MKIYLDNNRTTFVPKEVIEAMLPYFGEKYGNPAGLYSLALEADEAVERARDYIGQCIGADGEEITFTSGGTEANNLAVLGTALANKEKGKHIITTKIEHPSVLEAFRHLEREGFRVDYIGVDEEGFVDLDALEKVLDEETTLVSIMYVNHVIGTIEPLEEISRILSRQKKKIYLHTDAVEAFGKIEVNVDKLGVDMLSMSSHLIHGPKGVGALYVRKGTPVQPQSFGSSSLFRLRPGVENVPGIVGFHKAAEIAHSGLDEYRAHVREVRDHLIRRIEEEIPDARFIGPRGKKRSPYNANFSFRYVEGEALTLQLDMYGIAVATGSACASQNLKVNYVLLEIGLKHEEAHGSIRFSLSRYNTIEEMDYVVEKLSESYIALRKVSAYKPRSV